MLPQPKVNTPECNPIKNACAGKDNIKFCDYLPEVHIRQDLSIISALELPGTAPSWCVWSKRKAGSSINYEYDYEEGGARKRWLNMQNCVRWITFCKQGQILTSQYTRTQQNEEKVSQSCFIYSKIASKIFVASTQPTKMLISESKVRLSEINFREPLHSTGSINKYNISD